MTMGSSLGPTFADYYMSTLENHLLSQDRASNPVQYFRYVDDTFVIFKSRSHVQHFKRRMEKNSKLKFTYEIMEGSVFNFLDLSLRVEEDGTFNTSIFIKPTDKGVYANFHSHIPLEYKKSVVRSLVIRAIKFSSTWKACSDELKRITQIMANNAFPQALVEKIINMQLSNFNLLAKDKEDEDDNAMFYLQLYNLSKYEGCRKEVNRIVGGHVSNSSTGKNAKVVVYYKPHTLASHFSTRSRACDLEQSGVVYHFQCAEPGCSAGYIGHTMQTLSNRIKQHRRVDSSICKHFDIDHNKIAPEYIELKNCFKILYKCSDSLNVKLVEALKIKFERPFINVKNNEMNGPLRLF